MSRFTEFTRERRYLHNVSLATVSWYTPAFKWLPSESPTQDELRDVVLRMREARTERNRVQRLFALEQRCRAKVRRGL
jgi:predicted secreted protein